MDIERYINVHLILKNAYDVPGCLYTDLIVDDPIGLIEAIDGSRYFISEILWWERTLQGQQPKLGAGGVADPRSPDDYFLAETSLCEEFEKTAVKQDYCEYFQRINLLYPEICLYPSFDIAFR